jgi:predicted dehydrogenase
LEINGTKGTIYTVDVVRGGRMGGRLEVRAEGCQATYEWDGSDMYREELVAFADAILEGRDPPCSGLAGLHNQRLLDACYESAKTGRIVDVR